MIPAHIRSVVCERFRGVNTPYYLIDVDGVQAAAASHRHAWTATFPRWIGAYPFKVNPLRIVTQALRACGYGAEVSSGTELEWALADGFTAGQIFFNGPAKSLEELRLAVDVGARVQVDGVDEFQRLVEVTGRHRGRPKVSIRIAASTVRQTVSRLGCTSEEFDECLALASRAGIAVDGVHIHVGSNLPHSGYMVNGICTALPAIRTLTRDDPSNFILNIGGGFPARSATTEVLPNAVAFVTAIRETFQAIALQMEGWIVTEPGRSLVEDHGYFITSVVARKSRGSKNILVVDSGINRLRSIATWRHEIDFVDAPAAEAASRYTVTGHLCFEQDVLAEDVIGPRIVSIGDRIIVGSAGGYDLPSANHWGRPTPAIFALRDSQIFPVEPDGRVV